MVKEPEGDKETSEGNDIKKWAKCDNIEEAKKRSENRNIWKKIVHNLLIEDVT